MGGEMREYGEMAQQVLARQPRARSSPIHFGCASCGAVLSVPEGMAGMGGPCPMCGEWVVSPTERDRRPVRKAPAFVSRRAPVPAVNEEVPAKTRPEGRVDWRQRRRRYERMVSWFQRWQARLCVAAFAVGAATLAYLHSRGWNLPWNLPEDSAMMRVIEEIGHPGSGVQGLPTRPARRP